MGIWVLRYLGVWFFCLAKDPYASPASWHFFCGSGFPAATIKAESLSYKE
jgi:hypothetical protein